LLPDFLSVYFDPTLKKFAGTELVGYYPYDDEGVKAHRVTVVDKGILKNFLMSRAPIEGFDRSNGHGRLCRLRAHMCTKPKKLKVAAFFPCFLATGFDPDAGNTKHWMKWDGFCTRPIGWILEIDIRSTDVIPRIELLHSLISRVPPASRCGQRRSRLGVDRELTLRGGGIPQKRQSPPTLPVGSQPRMFQHHFPLGRESRPRLGHSSGQQEGARLGGELSQIQKVLGARSAVGGNAVSNTQ